MKRREFLLGSGAAAGVLGLSGFGLAAGTQELVIQPASFALRDQVTDGMVSLSPGAPPPVL